MFEIMCKYAIKAENGWASGYDYDEVKRISKAVITKRENDYDGVILEGFCVINGKKLFCIKNVCCGKDGDGYCIIQRENGNYYIFFDETRKIHGPFKSIELKENGVLVSKTIKCKDKEKRVYGVYSYFGDRILKAKYDKIVLHNEAILVSKGKETGVFQYDGECTVPIKYDTILFCERERILKVHSKESGNFGVFDVEGRVIIPVKYNSITYVKGAELFVARLGNRFAIYDIDGYKIFSEIFDECISIPKTSMLKLVLNDETLYYIAELGKLFQEDCIKTGKNSYKFFDGKWNKIAYRK